MFLWVVAVFSLTDYAGVAGFTTFFNRVLIVLGFFNRLPDPRVEKLFSVLCYYFWGASVFLTDFSGTSLMASKFTSTWVFVIILASTYPVAS